MKTCVIAHEFTRLWENSKTTLINMDFQIVQENQSTGKMSARQNDPLQSCAILVEICIEEQSPLIIISVDVVQNNSVDGMICTHSSFELSFLKNLLGIRSMNADENAFRIKQEDYVFIG
ncbi:MAG: hypothetical protein EYC69_14245 [Bacteroidetes bacterium]|nr:MAG: hypothetical protein EYC69_14245 [Bacteroidota bacterium]